MSWSLLIVDDEELARFALRKMSAALFPEIGEILEAAEGQSAIEIVRKSRPQLVLMDVRMPGPNGLDAAARLLAIAPDTRIIVVTAYDRFPLAQRAVNLGLDGYLLKPVIEEEFRKTVAGALSRLERLSRRERLPAPATGGRLPPGARHALEERLAREAAAGYLPAGSAAAAALARAWDWERLGEEERLDRALSFAYELERERERGPVSAPATPPSGGQLARFRAGQPLEVLAELLDEAAAAARSLPPDEPPARIRAWLASTPPAELSLDSLAERLGLSAAHASRVFKEAIGRNFAPYVAELRMERARALAASRPELTVEELARAVGYADPAYFSKLFREHAGMSPREWSRAAREGRAACGVAAPEGQ